MRSRYGEAIRVGMAVERQGRRPGSGIPVVPNHVDELRRHPPPVPTRLAQEERQRGTGGRRVEQLADSAPSPELGDPVPAVSGQQRDGVDHHQLLHQLRPPLRPDQRLPAPVVDDELATLDAELRQAALEEGGEPVHRVVEALGRAERPQPGMSIASAEPPRCRKGNQSSLWVGLPWQ
jgi:hypothetical protein